MSEEFKWSSGSPREQIYAEILPQIRAVVAGETDRIANLANVAAILKEALGFLWVGFYRVSGEDLVLGPFQGPLACTRIAFGRGVCGEAWRTRATLVVPDVDAFPGHIACSSKSRSEIVVPFFDERGEVTMVLDVDSDQLGDFGDVDRRWLEALRPILAG